MSRLRAARGDLYEMAECLVAYRWGGTDEDTMIGAMIEAENFALIRSALTSGGDGQAEPKRGRRGRSAMGV